MKPRHGQYFYDLKDKQLARTLRQAFKTCMSNRGRLLFVLRGLIEHNPIANWGPSTAKAFLCLFHGKDPDRAYRNIMILVGSLKNSSLETRVHLNQLISECAVAHEPMRDLRIYDHRRTPPNRRVTTLDWITTLREEIEVQYGPLHPAVAA